ASYVAKHHTVLHHLRIVRGVWQRVVFRWVDQFIEVQVNNGAAVRLCDSQLQSGYCFIGVKGGRAELKTINLTDLSRAQSDSHAKTARRKTVKFDRDSDRTAKSDSPRPGQGLWPFTGMPRRHLVYHMWPVRGSLWSWNLDQLKSRLDLFNGRRIL